MPVIRCPVTGKFLPQVSRTKKGDIQGTKLVELSRGMWALVDEAFPVQYKYSYCPPGHRRTGYAFRTVHGDKVENRKLHHDVREWELGRTVPSSEQVDHINNNGLDNRASNLRFVENSLSVHSRPKSRGHRGSPCSSRYKGVYWASDRGKWRAYIMRNRVQTWLGQYDTEEEAARAYNEAATRLYGEYADVNQLGD